MLAAIKAESRIWREHPDGDREVAVAEAGDRHRPSRYQDSRPQALEP